MLLAVALLAMGVAVLFFATGCAEGAGAEHRRRALQAARRAGPPSDIVIVGVDDKHAGRRPGTSPLDRARHAKVIEQLTKAGASVIAYDVPVHHESDDVDADNALIEAVAGAKKIVLGTGDVNPDGSTTIFGGGEGLEYSGATPADDALPGHRDGEDNEGDRVRRMPFSLSGSTRSASRSPCGAGEGRTPVRQRTRWIDFPGPPGTIPVIELRRRRGRAVRSREAVRGKIVVVGATSRAAATTCWRPRRADTG